MGQLAKGQLDPRIANSAPGVERIMNVLSLAMHEEKRLLMLEDHIGESILDLEDEKPDSRVRGPVPGVPFEVHVELRDPKMQLRTCRMRVLLTDTDFVIKGRASRHLHEPTHDFFVETAGSVMQPGQTVADLGLEANGLLMLLRGVPPYVGKLPWDTAELLKGTTRAPCETAPGSSKDHACSSTTSEKSVIEEQLTALLSDF